MTYDEAIVKFTALFNHEMSDEDMREFLAGIKLDESTPVAVIAAAAHVMRSFAITLPISDELRNNALDIVGTGGDKIGSFNISAGQLLPNTEAVLSLQKAVVLTCLKH